MFVKSFYQIAPLILTAVSANLAAATDTVASEKGRDERIVAVDDYSIDAGLWRNEFLALDDVVDTTGIGEGKPKSEAGFRIPQLSHRATGATLTFTDGLTGGVLSSIEADPTVQLSDWDQAVANPDVKGKKGSLSSGPSLTSYIVGLVSAIVIIGGLVSGK